MQRLRSWLPLATVVAAAVAFVVIGTLARPASPPRLATTVSTELASGLVASIADGDTLRLADNRRVRLVQVDAPELSRGECYGEAALRALERLLPIGTDVEVHTDAKLDLRDRFGRVLAYMFKQRLNVNLRLVEVGAAAPYFFRGARGRYARRLVRSARRARSSRRGLWGACPRTRLEPDRPIRTVR